VGRTSRHSAGVVACGGAAEPFGRPADLGDGWETATLEEVGLEAEPFRDLVEVVEDEPARAVHGGIFEGTHYSE